MGRGLSELEKTLLRCIYEENPPISCEESIKSFEWKKIRRRIISEYFKPRPPTPYRNRMMEFYRQGLGVNATWSSWRASVCRALSRLEKRGLIVFWIRNQNKKYRSRYFEGWTEEGLKLAKELYEKEKKRTGKKAIAHRSIG